jgi:hypothetical protein
MAPTPPVGKRAGLAFTCQKRNLDGFARFFGDFINDICQKQKFCGIDITSPYGHCSFK